MFRSSKRVPKEWRRFSVSWDNCPRFDSFEEMLAASPHIVWIATPTSFHATQAIAALDAGAHVFCEKPVSDSQEDALRVKHAAERSGRVFNVGYMLHFSPGLLALRKVIQQGELGRVLHAHVRMGRILRFRTPSRDIRLTRTGPCSSTIRINRTCSTGFSAKCRQVSV